MPIKKGARDAPFRQFILVYSQLAFDDSFLLKRCWCEVGKVRGRKTWLSIGNGCEYKHVMTHELGHAIGFWHEQSRPDRDSYLKINWENILDSKFVAKSCYFWQSFTVFLNLMLSTLKGLEKVFSRRS